MATASTHSGIREGLAATQDQLEITREQLQTAREELMAVRCELRERAEEWEAVMAKLAVMNAELLRVQTDHRGEGQQRGV